MKLLYDSQGNKYWFRGKDVHTKNGFIRKEEIEKASSQTVLLTNTARKMVVSLPGFIDMYRGIKRGAQIIPRKDIGLIVAETGIGRNSAVLEAGAGSGALCLFLANIARKVYSYEIREDFLEIVKRNIEMLEMKNIVLQRRDIYQGISQKNLDAVILDLPEPWKVVPHAAGSLKSGGFLVSYSPTLPQVSDFAHAVRQDRGFLYLKTSEVMLREWEIEGRKIRPKSQAIGHSGFVSFAKKY